MKQSLLALSLMTAFSGMACAQTNLTIYGKIDTAYVKETGADWRMWEWNDNRLGFKGTEDLGNGYKATFQLEKRFDLWNGSINEPEWEGAANVGLAGPFGSIRLGRVDEVQTHTFRSLDPFDKEGIGGMIRSTQHTSRIGNAARYDSPTFGGFSMILGYYLGENTQNVDLSATENQFIAKHADNVGFAGALKYDNGPLRLMANYGRLPDSDQSYIWSLGGAYQLGPVKLALGFEKTNDKGWKFGETSKKSKQDNWFFSADYKTGVHRFVGVVDWMTIKDYAGFSDNHSRDVKKYSVAYYYSLSKRTSLYGILAFSDYEDKEIAKFYDYKDDRIAGIQIGINHAF